MQEESVNVPYSVFRLIWDKHECSSDISSSLLRCGSNEIKIVTMGSVKNTKGERKEIMEAPQARHDATFVKIRRRPSLVVVQAKMYLPAK